MKYIAAFFSLILFFSCNKETKSQNPTLKHVAKEIITNSKNCALITVDSLGVAHVRTMDPFLPEDNFTIWMATNPKSQKVTQIKNNPKVSLYYFDKTSTSYLTLQGLAIIVNQNKEKEKYWKEEWKNFYKNRTTDYILIKFEPIRANVISEKYSILGDSLTWKTPTLKFKND